MSKSYYTPALEDIRLGYECEFTTDSLAFEVENRDCIQVGKLGALEIQFLLVTLYELSREDEIAKHVRTPFLNREALAADGWTRIDDKGMEYGNQLPMRTAFEKGNYMMAYDRRVPHIRLMLKDPAKKHWMPDPEQFRITIPCPSINELRYIMKWLDI